MLTGSLFTHEEPINLLAGRDIVDAVYHRQCQPCSWRHWYRLADTLTKMGAHSVTVVLLPHVDFWQTGRELEWKAVVCLFFSFSFVVVVVCLLFRVRHPTTVHRPCHVTSCKDTGLVVEHRRTRDWKVAGSNPVLAGAAGEFSSPGSTFCAQWLLFRYPFHPRVTSVHVSKRSRSFCH